MNGYGVDLAKDKKALQRLRDCAAKAKAKLSNFLPRRRSSWTYITQSEQGQLQLDARLTRAEFQKMTSDLLDRCRMPIEQVMKGAAVKPDAIGHVVLVGGSIRMPAVTDRVGS
jgi:molecular chaperone DnaK